MQSGRGLQPKMTGKNGKNSGFGSQLGAQRPDFRRQHHIQHLAQVAHAARAASAALEADHAFHRGDMAKAPEAKGVFQSGPRGQVFQPSMFDILEDIDIV